MTLSNRMKFRLKFGVDWANIEQDTAIYKLEIYKRCMDCQSF